MALSYFSEGEAPRDFRVSSTESDGHYSKCLLCYTVKRNFYCQDCIKNGNFVHSSMPYSDRYAEKQAKLLRLKVNRKHVLDRCEKLLSSKIKKDRLLTETKQSRDKIDLLRLAIEQRRNNIEERKQELNLLKQHNHDLSIKLPRYQKRVSLLGKHAQEQQIELRNKVSTYNEQVDMLAALRRSRIRQLTNYIFPVYLSYDTSESIEDMEFVGDDAEEEPPTRPQLHILNSWINIDGDFTHMQTWLSQSKDLATAGTEPLAAHRVTAALALSAQLTVLLAWTLDMRLPYAIALSEYCNWRVSASGAGSRWRRLQAACAALGARAGSMTGTGARKGSVTGTDARKGSVTGTGARAGSLPGPGAPLAVLHLAARAAIADDPALGRVEWCDSNGTAYLEWEDAGSEPHDHDDPPEHLCWPDTLPMEEPSSGPASLVTSAAASFASLWRGWTK